MTHLITRYPGDAKTPVGYSWPAFDDRRGLQILCPCSTAKPMQLGVVDDFGDIVLVPSRSLFNHATAVPA